MLCMTNVLSILKANLETSNRFKEWAVVIVLSINSRFKWTSSCMVMFQKAPVSWPNPSLFHKTPRSLGDFFLCLRVSGERGSISIIMSINWCLGSASLFSSVLGLLWSLPQHFKSETKAPYALCAWPSILCSLSLPQKHYPICQSRGLLA